MYDKGLPSCRSGMGDPADNGQLEQPCDVTLEADHPSYQWGARGSRPI